MHRTLRALWKHSSARFTHTHAGSIVSAAVGCMVVSLLALADRANAVIAAKAARDTQPGRHRQSAGPADGGGTGLVYGGFAVIQHLALRCVLWRSGALPLHLVAFLDYCAERIFLCKVGGGNVFVHRLLMEHFAALEPPAQDHHSESW